MIAAIVVGYVLAGVLTVWLAQRYGRLLDSTGIASWEGWELGGAGLIVAVLLAAWPILALFGALVGVGALARWVARPSPVPPMTREEALTTLVMLGVASPAEGRAVVADHVNRPTPEGRRGEV